MSSRSSSVTPDQIKVLRERTGAGIMECKKALEKTDGQMEEAIKLLQAQGADIAREKAGRETKQGLVGSYVHGGKIGVLVEVNCETDFVARTDQFKNLIHEVCLQVASMKPRYVSREEVAHEEIAATLAQLHEELGGIDEEATQPIQQSHMENFYKEQVLLDQPYIKDSSKRIQDLLNETVASLRENVVIRRFVRISLGESIPSSS